MGRRRRDPRDAWAPTRVYRGKSAWEWKSPGGKTVRLCRLDSPPHVVIERYQEAITLNPLDNTVAALANEYHNSAQFARLSPVTQKDYIKASLKPLLVFGKMRPDAVTPPMVRRYMDSRGVESQTRANRELSWLLVVFGFGFERGVVRRNPCIGVRKFTEERRRHYVSPEDYAAAYGRAPLPIRVAMEIAYCTGLRQADVLAMTWSQIKPDGIFVRQSKTKGELVKVITPRVQAALDLAKTLRTPENVRPLWVVHTRAGQRYTRDGFQSVWRRVEAGFRFHDLRRAGATDIEDADRQKFTGHASPQMAERYNAKPIKSPSH